MNLVLSPLSTGAATVLSAHARQRLLRLRADPRGDLPLRAPWLSFAVGACAAFAFSLARFLLVSGGVS